MTVCMRKIVVDKYNRSQINMRLKTEYKVNDVLFIIQSNEKIVYVPREQVRDTLKSGKKISGLKLTSDDKVIFEKTKETETMPIVEKFNSIKDDVVDCFKDLMIDGIVYIKGSESGVDWLKILQRYGQSGDNQLDDILSKLIKENEALGRKLLKRSFKEAIQLTSKNFDLYIGTLKDETGKQVYEAYSVSGVEIKRAWAKAYGIDYSLFKNKQSFTMQIPDGKGTITLDAKLCSKLH